MANWIIFKNSLSLIIASMGIFNNYYILEYINDNIEMHNKV